MFISFFLFWLAFFAWMEGGEGAKLNVILFFSKFYSCEYSYIIAYGIYLACACSSSLSYYKSTSFPGSLYGAVRWETLETRLGHRTPIRGIFVSLFSTGSRIYNARVLPFITTWVCTVRGKRYVFRAFVHNGGSRIHRFGHQLVRLL